SFPSHVFPQPQSGSHHMPPPPPQHKPPLTYFIPQIGKLALYTGAAGIHPEKTLPIVLDCGTANEGNLRDPLYLGLRQKRVSPEIALEFMDEFMAAVKEVYPNMLVQF